MDALVSLLPTFLPAMKTIDVGAHPILASPSTMVPFCSSLHTTCDADYPGSRQVGACVGQHGAGIYAALNWNFMALSWEWMRCILNWVEGLGTVHDSGGKGQGPILD